MSALNLQFIRASHVRGRVREAGKMVKPEFLLALDDLVRRKIDAACRCHNGGHKKLDASVLGHVSGGA